MSIQTYAEFWPFYLSQHSKPRTRHVHFLGTSACLAAVAVAIYFGDGWYLLAALALFYLPAWVAHFFVEGNRPATWKYPLWSFVSDLRMCFLWYFGRLDAEMKRVARSPASGRSDARLGPAAM